LNKYETIFIIDPNIEMENTEGIIEGVLNLISSNGGEITKVDKWGKKRLAYEVAGHREGYYVLLNFDADPQFIEVLSRYFVLTEETIKNMTVRAEKLPEPRQIDPESVGSKRSYDDDDDDDYGSRSRRRYNDDDDDEDDED